MANRVQIGDRVRFVSDVGGGVVRGFGERNTVLVEDEDGFQLPVPASEVVVVDTDGRNFERTAVAGKERPAPQPSPAAEPCERPVAYRPRPLERKDGDRVSLYLDFRPVNSREISSTAFEAYLVNDCNYYAAFAFLSRGDTSWRLRAQGVAEPNTKVLLEEIGRPQLNDLEHVAVQAVFWKQDRPFEMKPPVSVQPRVDTTKFCKPHTFRQSLFFDQPVLEFPLVVDDQPVRPVRVSAEELGRAMQEKARSDCPPRPAGERQERQRPGAHDIIEVDLHAHALLETTAGMQPGDIKEYQLKVFRDTLDAHLKEKGRRIVFIHGKGEGALRAAILAELRRRYKACAAQDASFQQYGFGATLVTIH